MPGHAARVMYSLGTDVNTPFFKYKASGPSAQTVFVSSRAVHCFVLAAKLLFQNDI